MIHLPSALQPFTQFKQFILYKLVPQPDGSTDKLPVNPNTLQVCDAHDKTAHAPYSVAAAVCVMLNDAAYGVAFVFTENDPFYFIDIDHCVTAGVISQNAINIMSYFPGAAVEISQSGAGLHIFGTAKFPEHTTKNLQYGIELYTSKRFVALTGNIISGSADADGSTYAALFVDTFFKRKSAGTGDITDWTETPVPGWNGYVNDEELIAHALKSVSAGAAFGNKCSFKDLWEANVLALSKAYPDTYGNREYDGSHADAALAQHLAFWTGNNCERIRNLMLKSALVRQKWERQDYLYRTILNAARLQSTVYTAGPADKTVLQSAPKLRSGSDKQKEFADNIRARAYTEATPEQQQVLNQATSAKFWIDNKEKPIEELCNALTPITAALSPISNDFTPQIVSGYQYMSASMQLEYFKGCIYIQDLHRVFTASGDLLKPEQFNATYGGYTFQMDELGDKTTKKAFEALTESQVTRIPKAQGMCFKPALPMGAVYYESGRACINVYSEIPVPRMQGDPTPFLEHLKKVLPSQRDQVILLSYMAACVQYKGIKFQWAPLLQGTEGNGKTLFTRCVAQAIGKRYTHYPKANDIDNKFNGWLLNKLLICVEDIYVPDNKREVLEALKPMITGGDGLEIQMKGVDQVTADICANFILNSNHKDAIKKTGSDRRFCVFYTAQQCAEDLLRDGMTGQYFPKLYDWLRAEGYAIVTDFLYKYQIPDEFNPAGGCHRAPATSTTSEALHSSLGGIEQEIIEAIEEDRPGFAGGWVSSVALDRLLNNLRAGRSIPPNKRREVLQGLGYDWHPALTNGRVNNAIPQEEFKKPRIFIKRGHPLAGVMAAADVVREYLKAQGYGG